MTIERNFYHSVLFFVLALFVSIVGYFVAGVMPVLCLLLVMTIGTSHGALDHLKGKQLLRCFHIESMLVFYVSYVLVGALTILVWLAFPETLLMVFLAVAAFHFGKEDSDFFISSARFPLPEVSYFLKGTVVISAPMLFHKSETLEIFEVLRFGLSGSVITNDGFLYGAMILGFLANLLLAQAQRNRIKILLCLDFFSVVMLNFFLHPLLAFTMYFCFLHSIRHSLSLINTIDNMNKSIRIFVKKVAPLTLITGIGYLISLYLITNHYTIDESILKVIFIGLASLTFPHILLEYMLEKKLVSSK